MKQLGIPIKGTSEIYIGLDLFSAVSLFEDEDIIAHQIICFPDNTLVGYAIAIKLTTFSVDHLGVARTSHIEQQVMVIGIPSHILHLTIAVIGNITQVQHMYRLQVVIIDHHHEVVFIGTRRKTVEGEPSDVDGFGDVEFKTLCLRDLRKVVTLLVHSQTIHVAGRLVLG